MSGTLYGVGTGPGDPELMTLKAHRVISQASIIAYLVNANGEGLAHRIAKDMLNRDALHVPVHVPMAVERAPAQTAYNAGAEALAAHLEAGRDVVFLCAGDPFFYGSFMYMFERLKDRFVCKLVPGVTSLTACAAELGRPLAARNDVLKVLPAPLASDVLRAELERCDAVAIIKVGRHFSRIRKLLDELDLTDHAHIIESAGLPEQKTLPVADIPTGEQSYFSTILIYKGSEAW